MHKVIKCADVSVFLVILARHRVAPRESLPERPRSMREIDPRGLFMIPIDKAHAEACLITQARTGVVREKY